MSIPAFHVNCTAPYLLSNRGKEYKIEYFELLSTILSALQWQSTGGKISMITDPVGAQYYRSIGLDKLWNGGVDNSLHLDIQGIDPISLWAAGKIFALHKMKVPCVMLDTDFIVWEDISTRLTGKSLVVAHREELYDDVYPPMEHFSMSSGYSFSNAWDWEVLPCNTAFAYFGDEQLRKHYVQSSIKFMQGIKSASDTLTYMVFAEQRLLAMCAAEMGIEISTLLDMDAIFLPQKKFTHIWGYKQHMRDNENSRNEFCKRCEERIRRDFPESAHFIERIRGSELVLA